MAQPTNNQHDEAWQIHHAREVLAESKAAPSTKDNCPRYWGKLEAALEALLDHLDRQAGQR